MALTQEEIDALIDGPDVTAAIVLKAVNATLLELTMRTDASYTIRGRSYTNQDLDKLRRLRDALKEEVASEDNDTNGYGNTALVRFGNPR